MNTYERFAKEEAQRSKGLVEKSEPVGQILQEAVAEEEKVIAEGYKAIEDGVVGTYKAIENGVVGTYQKTEDFFVGKFLTRPGETVEEAKKRMQDSVKK